MRQKRGALESRLLANQREQQKEYEESINRILLDLENDINEDYPKLKEDVNMEVKEFTLDFNRM